MLPPRPPCRGTCRCCCSGRDDPEPRIKAHVIDRARPRHGSSAIGPCWRKPRPLGVGQSVPAQRHLSFSRQLAEDERASCVARLSLLLLQARETKRSPFSTHDSTKVGAFHDSATLNLAKRRLCDALGTSRGCAAHCCAISNARARAALTASIPRSNRPLARRANFGAAKSCSLVIFMIAPRRPKLIRSPIRGLLMAVSPSARP